METWGGFVNRKHDSRIDKMFKKAWYLTPPLFTFDSSLDQLEKLFNQTSHSENFLRHLLPIESEYTYNLHKRINS